uniref:Uncharacterized protein n=1 Tax=Moniliophthora roreri TaxID=221103 RepID=A0A0W0GC73_MONRR
MLPSTSDKYTFLVPLSFSLQRQQLNTT